MDFPDSLAIRFCHPLLPAGLLDDNLCPYRAVVDKFLLVVQHLHVHVKRPIEECQINLNCTSFNLEIGLTFLFFFHLNLTY